MAAEPERRPVPPERSAPGPPSPAEPRAALVAYCELIPLAVLGAVLLRRRGISLAPFLGLVAMVTITAVVAIGLTRYRVPVDLALCLPAAVGFDALLERWRPARTRPSPAAR